jgi:integrase
VKEVKGPDGTTKKIQRRNVVYGKFKDEVLKKLRKLQTQADPGRLPDAGSLSVGQYLASWLAGIQGTLAGYTETDYRRDVERYLAPHRGAVRLASLTALHVRQLYADLGKAGVRATMQRKAGTTLGIALAEAVKLGLVPRNVARDARKPRAQKTEMRSLAESEVKRFLAATKDDRLHALYVLLVDVGLRPAEAFALRWRDVEEGAVRVLHTLEEIAGKLTLKGCKTDKSHRRRVARSAYTGEALTAHKEAMRAEGHAGPDDPVFCDARGGWRRQLNVMRRSSRPALKRAGLPETVRPYDLRHTTATLLPEGQVDAKVIAERLGHSTTRLTQGTYQHVLRGMQERAAAKMDGFLRSPPQTQTSSLEE